MGISIHYKGRIKDPTLLPALIEEVEDIAKSFGWDHFIFDRAFPEGSFSPQNISAEHFFGMMIKPPGCENLDIAFLSNGELHSFINWKFYTEKKDPKELSEYVSVKTQFAGVEIHKMLIHLLDHLSKKYFSEFSMNDEADYWETRDEAVVEKKFKFMEEIFSLVIPAIQSTVRLEGESYENYFDRILKELGAGSRNKK